MMARLGSRPHHAIGRAQPHVHAEDQISLILIAIRPPLDVVDKCVVIDHFAASEDLECLSIRPTDG